MGRKVETVTVPPFGGRDDGKIFQITEMSAVQAEKWALRMAIALKGTAGQVTEAMVRRLGFVAVGVATYNAFLQAELKWVDFEPLLDEMLTCVKVIRDPSNPAPTLLMDSDIEEVQVRGWLRSEVLRVHTGFSFVAALLSLKAQMATTSEDSPST